MKLQRNGAWIRENTYWRCTVNAVKAVKALVVACFTWFWHAKSTKFATFYFILWRTWRYWGIETQSLKPFVLDTWFPSCEVCRPPHKLEDVWCQMVMPWCGCLKFLYPHGVPVAISSYSSQLNISTTFPGFADVVFPCFPVGKFQTISGADVLFLGDPWGKSKFFDTLTIFEDFWWVNQL